MYLNHEPWFQAPYLRCLRLLCLRSRRKGEDESLSAKRKRKVFKSSSRSQPLEINLRQHHLSLTPRRSSPSQNCCCKNLVFLFVSFDATTRTASTHGMFENSTLKRFYGTSHISWNVCTARIWAPGHSPMIQAVRSYWTPFRSSYPPSLAWERLLLCGFLTEVSWPSGGGTR